MKKQTLCFLLLFLPVFAFAQNLAIIPQPVSVIKQTGFFNLNNAEVLLPDVSLPDPDVAFFINQINKPEIVFVTTHQPEKNLIEIQYAELGDGAYEIKITPNKVTVIVTPNTASCFYAMQTLLQLVQPNGSLPCCEIKDAPSYKWRGMHLDCSRHFFSKQEVMRYIDLLAMYKMNVFHWHLTDDQGWRIEIKKYPLLTTVGSKRQETIIAKNFDPYKGDGIPYQGFYTQEDVKEIIAYATERHITVVPEIEMPGHSMAALAAYPQYACKPAEFNVLTRWGVSDDIYCPTEATFQFLENVLTEVMALFPSSYIHIGGDEAPKTRWKECPNCQALIKSKHLKNENELQSYFISRIDSFLTAHGRNTVGWDEILEGGLAQNATVMSWRGTEGGIAAARQHHYVVMCPGSHCYFDHYQGNRNTEPLAIGGYTTVKKVYSYNPLPDSLSNSEKQYILGAQGNIWTEYIPSFSQVEYMALPRMLALSEVLWTPLEKHNYDDFKKRLLVHFDRFDKMEYNYSKAIFDIQSSLKPAPDNNGILLTLQSEYSTGNILVSDKNDGAEPDATSTPYTKPILINQTQNIQAAYFDKGLMKGKNWSQDFIVSKSTGKKVTLTTPPAERYSTGGAFTLVDGVRGGIPWYSKEWLGWQGTNAEAVIDLGAKTTFKKISIGTLKDEASWIYLPSKIEVLTSDDAINFISLQTISAEQIITNNQLQTIELPETSARFIKVKVENAGVIVDGKPGAGEKAWLFLDEISVE